MLVKSFAVDAGTTIMGVRFENNDPATVFPEVVLLRGPLEALGEETALASAANVRETSGGVVAVTWTTPVVTGEAGTYYVGVCPPAGPGKQGLGVGPALGANEVETPNGSYLACGAEQTLQPIQVGLAMRLMTNGSMGGAAAKAARQAPEDPPAAAAPRTFLKAHGRAAVVLVEYGLPQQGQTSLSVYDVAGRLVRELAKGTFEGGRHVHAWDGRDQRGREVSAGVYFVRLQAGLQCLVQKVVVAR
jgi:hypothetical protein